MTRVEAPNPTISSKTIYNYIYGAHGAEFPIIFHIFMHFRFLFFFAPSKLNMDLCATQLEMAIQTLSTYCTKFLGEPRTTLMRVIRDTR